MQQVANIKVFKDVKTVIAIHKGVQQTKWVKEEIELKWSDRFWLFFLKYYAETMEGMIPFVSPLLFNPQTRFHISLSTPSVTLMFAGSQTQSRIDWYSSWRQRDTNVLHANHNGRNSEMDPMPTFSHVQSMVDMVHIHPDSVCTLSSNLGKGWRAVTSLFGVLTALPTGLLSLKPVRGWALICF